MSDEELREMARQYHKWDSYETPIERTNDLTRMLYQVRDQTAQRVEARLRGDGEPCYYCAKPINDLAANPGLWGVFLCHEDAPGIIKWHHVECVSKRLAPIAQIEQRVRRETLEEAAGMMCSHCLAGDEPRWMIVFGGMAHIWKTGNGHSKCSAEPIQVLLQRAREKGKLSHNLKRNP